MEQPLISGIAYNGDEAKLTITGVPDQPGVASQIFGPLSEAHINVDMIIQNASDTGNASISITVPAAESRAATTLLQQALSTLGTVDVSCDPRVGKLSVSGIGLRSHADVAARVFRILAEEQINVQLVNTSEIKVSILVTPDEARRGSEALRREFRIDG